MPRDVRPPPPFTVPRRGTAGHAARFAVPGLLVAVVSAYALRFPPSDPNYASVRAHLPRLRPGRSVPVPPFP